MLIVGGGVVGLTTSLFLAQQGIRCVLVEKHPGTSIHRVEPVTHGVRLAAFFWIQSMVREEAKRDVLFELDTAVQQLGGELGTHPALVKIAGAYHNLLRLWSDT